MSLRHRLFVMRMLRMLGLLGKSFVVVVRIRLIRFKEGFKEEAHRERKGNKGTTMHASCYSGGQALFPVPAEVSPSEAVERLLASLRSRGGGRPRQ